MTARFTRAAYGIQGRVDLGREGEVQELTYEISCVAGEQPRVTLHASGLTPTGLDELHAIVQSTLDRLDIPCRCGESWLYHDAASPHGRGKCRSFTAASPLADKVPE